MSREEIMQMICDELSLELEIIGSRVEIILRMGTDRVHNAVAYLPDLDGNP